jgi:hypothetical protein
MGMRNDNKKKINIMERRYDISKKNRDILKYPEEEEEEEEKRDNRTKIE